MYLNDITFAGHMGRDAEDKVLPGGTRVVKFSLCYNDKDKNGEKKSTWISVSVFGNWCDYAASFRKGDNVIVKGKLTISTSKEGDKTYAEILAHSCGVLAKTEAKGFETDKPVPISRPAEITSKTMAFDGDIPF